MKVLQSAVLQQQLTAAALSCRMNEDYNRFVAAYQQKLVQSDRALKAFFSTRPRGEDYDAYKARIANVVSLKSLHDPKFCENAQKVFDVALGRGMTRRGLAPEPPQMVETGYEGCRPVADRLMTAHAEGTPKQPPAKALPPKPVPRPVAASASRLQVAASAKSPSISKLGQVSAVSAVPDARSRFDVHAVDAIITSLTMARPVPTPRPNVSPQAEKALALAKTRTAAEPLAMKPAPKPAAEPQRLASLEAKAKADAPPLPPARWVAEPEPAPAPAPAPRMAERDGVVPDGEETVTAPAREIDDEAPVPSPERQHWQHAPDDNAPVVADVGAERARTDRDGWDRARTDRSEDDIGAFLGRNVPNAYRPGAEWVDERVAAHASPSWQPVVYGPPPPWLNAPRGAYMVRGRDGRWMVVIGHQRYWVRD